MAKLSKNRFYVGDGGFNLTANIGVNLSNYGDDLDAKFVIKSRYGGGLIQYSCSNCSITDYNNGVITITLPSLFFATSGHFDGFIIIYDSSGEQLTTIELGDIYVGEKITGVSNFDDETVYHPSVANVVIQKVDNLVLAKKYDETTNTWTLVDSGVAGQDDNDVFDYVFDNYNGLIFIKGGTYTELSGLTPQSNSIIVGEGVDKTILDFADESDFLLYNPDITFRDFTIEGRFFINNSRMKFYNIKNTCDETRLGAFTIWTTNDNIIEDIVFMNCYAHECGTFGFYNTGDGDVREIRNVRYIDCHAYKCGYSTRFSDWIVGFDVAEYLTAIEDCVLIGCSANYSWESGFHLEDAPNKTNVMFLGCISEYNGQKPSANYGAGFLVSSGVSLYNCQTKGNAVAGIRFNNNKESCPLIISDCKDEGSYISLHGWGNPSSGEVFIKNFTSVSSTYLAVELLSTNNIFVDGLNIIDPAGDGDICTLFGNATYPIDNCRVRGLNAIGGQSPKVIYTASSNNLYFEGYINTSQTYPFYNDGSTNVEVELSGSYISKNNGVLTTDGDGVKEQFEITHGLSSTPSIINVWKEIDNLPDIDYITADATKIYVNFVSAPANGSDNVKLGWYAHI